MKDTPIGIGVIGCGYMGLTYCEAIHRHLPTARLRAIHGGRRAPALAKDYGVSFEETAESLVARTDVDVVLLATPDFERVALTRLAAAAGKHVLAEKPLAPTVAECDQMIALCAAAGVRLGVVATERFREVTRRAKQLIDEGAVGPVRMMRTVTVFPRTLVADWYRERPWMADPRSGGLFVSAAVHNCDFLRWLTGRNAVRVFAQAATWTDLPGENQSVMAQFEFEGGIMAQLWVSAELPTPSFPSSEVRFQVAGRDGMIDLENFEFLDLGRGDKWERVLIPKRFDYMKEPKSPIRLVPHIGVVSNFVDALRNDSSEFVTAADGRAALAMCEACLVSARTGRAVDLPLPTAR
jgi:predicted dehydrogenase